MAATNATSTTKSLGAPLIAHFAMSGITADAEDNVEEMVSEGHGFSRADCDHQGVRLQPLRA